MSLILVTDSDNQPDVTPDDFFTDHAIPARSWVVQETRMDSGATADHVARVFAARARAYIGAYGLYREAAKSIYGEHGDPLRHEPYVLSEYDSLENQAKYLFIFKADNNGNTYRIRWIPERGCH